MKKRTFVSLSIISVSLLIGFAQAPRHVPTIAFASFSPLTMNIFVATGDGNNAKPLPIKPDLDYNPSYSREGAWIVFTSHRGGSADIYRVHPDGSTLERLTDDPAFDDQGALSPDGKSLAFVSTRGGHANIWLLDILTHKLKNLTPDSSGDFRPAWSPDGERIAFSSDRDSKHPKITFAELHSTEIFVMKKDGSDVRRITRNETTAGSPAWSHDGSRIVYYETVLEENRKIVVPLPTHGDMQLVSVDWMSGKREVLTARPGEKWSPHWISPSQIAYISGGDSGGVERIGGTPGARGEFWNANWSADGKSMVFVRETHKPWPPLESWRSLDPGYRLVRTGVFPSYSPSGDRLICNSATAGILHNSILVMNADGSHRSVLFDDPERSALAPVWSPLGDKIAFGYGGFFQMTVGKAAGVSAATSQLAIINVDGTGLQVFPAAGDHAGFPSWSPDARRLVYRVSGKTGKGLRILDLASQRVTELTNDAHNDNFPSWSPVDDRIAFTSDRDGDYELYSIRADGSELKRLTHARGNDAHCGWSPDGKWIAFTSARTGYKDEAVLHPHNTQPEGEIYVMRSDGSDVHRLTENQFEEGTPAWRPGRK